MDATELVRQGDVDGALKALIDEVRKAPTDAKHRIFLFQLLCVTGDWARAKTHLEVAKGLDDSSLLMAQVYGDALALEETRAKIFAGKATPTVFGKPEAWVAKLSEALRLDAIGEHVAAAALRAQAYDEAPSISGEIDGHRFEWLADADSRLGPVLEVIINGRFFWLPFQHISALLMEEPTDLRDIVWTAVQIKLSNGGEIVGLIPTRYFGSEASKESQIRLARKTEWVELLPPSEDSDGTYAGLGQRLFATDTGDFSLLDTRQISFDQPEAETTEEPEDAPDEAAAHG